MNNKNKRKGYLLAGMLIVLAAIFIVGIFKLQQQDPSNPVETMGESDAQNSPGSDPSLEFHNAEPVVSPPPSEQTEESSSEEAVSPYLLDYLPFTEDEVKSVSVVHGGAKKKVPSERKEVLLQSLRFTDMQAAVTEVPSFAERTVLQFNLNNDQVIELPYYLESNAIAAEGKAYYANDQVMLLMHDLLKPDSELGVFAALEQRIRQEMEQGVLTEPQGVDREKIAVDGLIYAQWEDRLKSEEAEWEIPYYDYASGEVRKVAKYKAGVLYLYNQIVFSDSTHETPDGVKVGLTPQEVDNRLDAEASTLPSIWSYKSGDYFRFHLYYDNSKVKYMVLSQPL